MRKSKARNVLAVFLFSLCIGQACYAEESVFNKARIESVELVKVEETGLRIFDKGRNRTHYQFSFASKQNCSDPSVSLEATDKASLDKYLDPTTNFKVDENWKYWKIDSGIIEDNSGFPGHYFVKFGNSASVDGCQAEEGNMPELQAALSAVDKSNGSRKLILTNVSDKKIAITSIKKGESNDDIHIGDYKDKKEVLVGNSSDIDLTPSSICSEGRELSKELKLLINYEVYGQSGANDIEVTIGYSCKWLVERMELMAQSLSSVSKDIDDCKKSEQKSKEDLVKLQESDKQCGMNLESKNNYEKEKKELEIKLEKLQGENNKCIKDRDACLKREAGKKAGDIKII